MTDFQGKDSFISHNGNDFPDDRETGGLLNERDDTPKSGKEEKMIFLN